MMGSQLVATRPDQRYDGVVGMWYGKAPGLDRATDALRDGVFAGSNPAGGSLAVVSDDPAAKSSTMPSSSDAALLDLHMPVLYPSTIAECLELGLHAVALSRATGLWSAMKRACAGFSFPCMFSTFINARMGYCRSLYSFNWQYARSGIRLWISL